LIFIFELHTHQELNSKMEGQSVFMDNGKALSLNFLSYNNTFQPFTQTL
jgi:hypothetical protein